VELKLCKVSKIRFPSTDLNVLTIGMNISFSRSLLYGNKHIYIFENRTQTSAGLSLTFDHIICIMYRSFATRVSQLKMYDFSGEAFKDFEML
jgi:hypothetical protein